MMRLVSRAIGLMLPLAMMLMAGPALAKSADEMSAAELQADAQRIVDKLQASYAAAVQAVADANASGDPSAIENANAALAKATTLLNKAQKDKTDLDKAVAEGKPLAAIKSIYDSLSEAEVFDNETQSALASITGTTTPTSTVPTGTLNTEQVGSQPTLTTEASNTAISGTFQTEGSEGTGYDTDRGTGGTSTGSSDETTVVHQTGGTATGLF